MNPATITLLVLLGSGLGPPGWGWVQGQDRLRSKDALERLAGIEELEQARAPDAARALGRLLADPDWEVMERAAVALGKLGSARDAAGLADLAVAGPVRRVRHAAARSAAALDADAAAGALLRKARGATALPALEALAIVLPSCKEPPSLRPLEALLRERDGKVRAAAARALWLGARAERAKALGDFLGSEHLMVRAAVLESAAEAPDPELLPVLRKLLAASTALDPTLERRARRAWLAGLRGLDGPARMTEALSLVTELGSAPSVLPAARGARLARDLAAAELVEGEALLRALGGALAHADEGVRAQGAAVLAAVGGEGAGARARELAATDRSARVRRAATGAVLALEGVATESGLAFAIERLGAETDPLARQDLVVALGQRELEGALPVLVGALADGDWRVRVAAAVSLGKTRLAAAREPLEGLRRPGAGDWRTRAGALAGLLRLYRVDALPAVIEGLEDEEVLVRRMAHGWLVAATGQELAAEAGAWRAWLKDAGPRARLVDLGELDERRRRYGYEGVSLAEVYRGLDVLVLESRGDHIEKLLSHLSIPHGMTRAGRVRASGPDPRGVFVSNCTGELSPEDLEPLEFFLHAGGYLFGSCWAVEETIARLVPGEVRRLATRDEVVDRVTASPAAPDSPYLAGVFGEATLPLYELQGAYLIEVLAPERVEVLVDSPEAAERWGGGELAAWFRVGHGVVLDSVNHFDVQGLELAQGLRRPADRQAYAVDHMGLGYAELRASREMNFWSTNHRAAQVVHDLSVLRLVTNFVRLRRLAGD